MIVRLIVDYFYASDYKVSNEATRCLSTEELTCSDDEGLTILSVYARVFALADMY